MTTISKRIQEVISASGLTKARFGEMIEISAPSVTRLCTGENSPSKQTISLICSKFNIRREWLENGVGPMRLPEIDDLSSVNLLLEDELKPVPELLLSLLEGYQRLTPENRKVIDDYLNDTILKKY